MIRIYSFASRINHTIFDFAICLRVLNPGHDMPNSRFIEKGFEAALAISIAILFIGIELASMIGYDLLNRSYGPEPYQHFLNQVLLVCAVAASNSPPARMYLELSSRTIHTSFPLIVLVCGVNPSEWTTS
jgi:hypothetical protein